MRLLLLSVLIWACSSISTEAQTVYVTKTGTKYHRETCHYLKHSKLSASLADAKRNGYGACKVCKPSVIVTGYKSKTDSSMTVTPTKHIKSVISKQCAATARSTGNRCKRITKNPSGKCWQHE